MTYKTFQAIETALASIFVELDAEFVARQQEWAKGRVAAIKEYVAENSAKRRAMGESAYYDGLFNVAGGKTWWNVFYGRSPKMVEEFVTKNCAATIAKRNASISAKLEKAGILEVVSSDYSRSANGFDGVFVVMTDKGRKVVTINTIVAGGYNIQCMHQRTLIKV
jgi:hypothetical protein